MKTFWQQRSRLPRRSPGCRDALFNPEAKQTLPPQTPAGDKANFRLGHFLKGFSTGPLSAQAPFEQRTQTFFNKGATCPQARVTHQASLSRVVACTTSPTGARRPTSCALHEICSPSPECFSLAFFGDIGPGCPLTLPSHGTKHDGKSLSFRVMRFSRSRDI